MTREEARIILMNLASFLRDGTMFLRPETEEQFHEAYETAMDVLRQPEIICCRDCKHYQFADNRAFGFPVKRCEWTGFEDVDDDDFCSRAERREEGGK